MTGPYNNLLLATPVYAPLLFLSQQPGAPEQSWADMWKFVVIALLVAGCRKESVEMERQVVDGTGTNALVLYSVVGRTPLSSEVDYDFHSIVWRTRVGTNWTDRSSIGQQAFQGGSVRRRWVNEIDSFDSAKGTAVIKVGEESPPVKNGSTTTVSVVYSWREWSLLTNGEVRVLRICKDPFEKY